jgi:hypothetical protein
MSRKPRQSNYLHGIRQAEQDGLIAYACSVHDKSVRHARLSDEYSHICDGDEEPLALKYTNTRPLSFAARQLLSLYTDDSNVRFLELGPGAGVACAAVNRLLPGAAIDTVSLTPLNPYLRFRRDDLYECITESCSQEEDLSYFFMHALFLSCEINTLDSFHQTSACRKRAIILSTRTMARSYTTSSRMKMTSSRASVSLALSLLQRDGTMLIMASDGSYRIEDALESATIDTDVLVTCKKTTSCHIFPCLVARRESPLSRRLREGRSGLLSKSERVLRLDFQAWESIFSNMCISRN